MELYRATTLRDSKVGVPRLLLQLSVSLLDLSYHLWVQLVLLAGHVQVLRCRLCAEFLRQRKVTLTFKLSKLFRERRDRC